MNQREYNNRLRLIACALMLVGCSSTDRSQDGGGNSAIADSVIADSAGIPGAAAPDTASMPPARPDYVEPDPVLFDPSKIAKGDTIAGLTVTDVDLQRAAALLPDSPYVGNVRFRGRIELTGKLMAHHDPEHRALCFQADEATAHRLPRMYNDERRPWFCFANYDEARVILGDRRPPLPVRIVVDDFMVHYSFSDGYNTAQLRSVYTLPGDYK